MVGIKYSASNGDVNPREHIVLTWLQIITLITKMFPRMADCVGSISFAPKMISVENNLDWIRHKDGNVPCEMWFPMYDFNNPKYIG